MAHWEVVVPILKLGFCGGRLMLSSDCEPGDATSWDRGTSAPNLGAGIPASTALSAPLVGWKTSWS